MCGVLLVCLSIFIFRHLLHLVGLHACNQSMFVRRYLSFLKGIVDSDTLPLSVSRETLQAHSSLKVIKKKIVRKVLDALKRLSDAERDAAKSTPHTF